MKFKIKLWGLSTNKNHNAQYALLFFKSLTDFSPVIMNFVGFA